MSETEGREIWFLNRDVMVVRPAQPFVDWALALDEDGELDAAGIMGSSNAFLVPEHDHDEETWAWVEGHCETMFEYMLLDWSTDAAEWPEDRGWTEFQRWFTCEHIAVAWDLVDEPLSSEAPADDEEEGGAWDA